MRQLAVSDKGNHDVRRGKCPSIMTSDHINLAFSIQLDSSARASTEPLRTCGVMEDSHRLKQRFMTWIKSFQPSSGDVATEASHSAHLTPPINPASLFAIDKDYLTIDPQFRSDMNFNSEVRFILRDDPRVRSSSSGSADDYWLAIQHEFEFHHFMVCDSQNLRIVCPDEWDITYDRHTRRITAMFATLKAIIYSLVDQDDQAPLLEILEESRLKQQIRHCTLDFSFLATWLGFALRLQCASVRDQAIDEWVRQMQQLCDGFDPHALVNAMRKLFDILQMMKLDVTNHLIRGFRQVWLHNNFMHFQQHYTLKKRLGQFDDTSSSSWYRASFLPQRVSKKHEPLRHFVTISVCSILMTASSQPAPDCFPPTFELDYSRLDVVADGVRSWIHIKICEDALIFKLRVEQHRSEVSILSALTRFRTTISLIFRGSKWEDVVENVAIEMFLYTTTESVEHINPREDLRYPDCSETFKRQSRRRLPDNLDVDEVEKIANILQRDLNPNDTIFQGYLSRLGQQLLEQMPPLVVQNIGLSAPQLFEKFTLGKVGSDLSPSPARKHPCLACLTRPNVNSHPPDLKLQTLIKSFIHILINHWNIWGPTYSPTDHGVFDYINDPAQPNRMRYYERYVDRFPAAKQQLYGDEALQDIQSTPVVRGNRDEACKQQSEISQATKTNLLPRSEQQHLDMDSDGESDEDGKELDVLPPQVWPKDDF